MNVVAAVRIVGCARPVVAASAISIRRGAFTVSCRSLFAHPGGDALVHALLEGGAEGAIAAVATLLGELLGDDGLLCSGKLAVAGYEVTDAKVVVLLLGTRRSPYGNMTYTWRECQLS